MILSGEATIGDDSADQHDAYAEKYAWGFERIGLTPEQFAASYSTPLHIRITKVRGHK